MKIFIGMETSGALRRRFAAKGHHVISCDTLPAEDGAHTEGHLHRSAHWEGDVFDFLESLASMGWVPDLAIFHPTCTYHTVSAAWAFNEPNYERYPGVGYHQKVRPGTLVGKARHKARDKAERDIEHIRTLPIRLKVIENPRGTLPTRTRLGKPGQVVHPYMFGDDASKETCLWFLDEHGNPVDAAIPIDPAKRVPGRQVEHNGKTVERWANQTDSGQNNLTPGADRWKDRSRTYPGLADALVEHLDQITTLC